MLGFKIMALGALTHQALGLKYLDEAFWSKIIDSAMLGSKGHGIVQSSLGVESSLLPELSAAVLALQALNQDKLDNPLVETGLEVYTEMGKLIELKVGDFVESRLAKYEIQEPHQSSCGFSEYRHHTGCGYVVGVGEIDNHVAIRFCAAGTGTADQPWDQEARQVHKDSILLVNDEIISAQTEFGNGVRDVDAIAKAMIADVAIAKQTRDLAEQERAAAKLEARSQHVKTQIETHSTDPVAANTKKSSWRDFLSRLVLVALCMGGLYYWRVC